VCAVPISIDRDDLNANLTLEPQQRAEWCVSLIDDADDLAEAIEADWAQGRRGYCEFLGVGESTLSGWLKEHRVPRYAKLAWGLERLAVALSEELIRVRREASDPQIVRVSDTHYQLCRFAADGDGVMIGQVIADHIPSFQDAAQMASVRPALRQLKRAKEVVAEMLERTENPLYIAQLEAQQLEIVDLMLFAVKHERWRDRKRAVREAKQRGEAARKAAESIDLSDLFPQSDNSETEGAPGAEER
jgi:transcriptional regulator with XRE-family HTH domain